MFKNILKDKEYKLILIIGGIIIFLLFIIYFFTIGTLTSFLQGSIVNLIIEIVSVLVTVILLSQLLERRQKRINKEKAYNIIQFRYFKMIANLYRSFYLFITKKQMIEKNEIDNQSKHFLKSIEELQNNIEIIIKEDFFAKKPVGMVYEPRGSNVFENFVEMEIDNFQMPLAMRQQFDMELNDFLMKYSIILPDDLRNHLYELHNKLETSPLFMSPYQMGMRPNPNNVKFNPAEFREHTLECLEIFESLFIYFREEENHKKHNSD